MASMDLQLEIEKCLGHRGWGAPPRSATAVRARKFPTQQRGPFVQGPLEGSGRLRFFNTQICILPHFRLLISDI